MEFKGGELLIIKTSVTPPLFFNTKTQHKRKRAQLTVFLYCMAGVCLRNCM